MEYVEDGISTSFAAPFRYEAATDLIVERIFDTGQVTLLAMGSDYTVSSGATDAGGTVTRTTATNGATLRIRRDTARAQRMAYPTGGRFPAESHEAALDRLMLIAQEQDAAAADITDRALLTAPGEVLNPLSGSRPGKVIGFGADPAQPLMLSPGGSDAALREDLASGPGAALVRFAPEFPGASPRALGRKAAEVVSVIDAGAKGDGITDDTAAFNAAIATGKTVIVPATVFDGTTMVRARYSVADIDVVDRLHIRGEKDGWNNAPLLLVRSTGAAAFLNSSDEIRFYLTIENLACGAALGVTGASFYKQTRQDRYSAYATFRNIETMLSLQVSYIIAPIFVLWDRCRDGGEGSASDNQHCFIQALALSYGQRDQFNVIRIKDCIVNNAFGTQGAIIASYGVTWNIENTDFEALKCSAFVGYNIDQLRISGCWIEGVRAANTIQLRNYAGTPASSHAVIDTVNFVFNGTGGTEVSEVLGIDELGSAVVKHSTFNLVPAGAKLTTTGNRLTVNVDNRAVSGAGAASFFDGTHHESFAGGRRLLQGAADNGVTGMTLQTSGGFSAPLGLLSRSGVDVGTAFVNIADSQTGFGGTVTISGFDAGDGSMFRFVKNWLAGTMQDVVPPINNTTRTMTFQVTGNSLQMKTDAGALKVSTTMQH
ncbi:glycosyl hydrolase family 28-related protein [Sphingomonas sp. GV3]|uniref:glycosyl hydrolase family 28-related protein n=1 Tax=Sphingomonas sp. GV3 TaxID=3040671 RepID=UPI00280AE805|nr:glycosyl hydrolase family 28-related protein [Sphingomonas sp. GV3]